MTSERRAIIVVDLAYGDCGKGSIVDFLTCHCRAQTIVRFNGGPQAGHNVLTKDGRHHTFSHFASGTFVPGVRTLLSRFMLIEPYALLNEAAHLQQIGVINPLSRLMIDRRCPVITPAHQAANRLREIARGANAHGTCGIGVGELMRDSIEHPEQILHAAELGDSATVHRKLRAACTFKCDQLREIIADIRSHPRADHAIHTLEDPSWIDIAADNYAHVARSVSMVDDQANTKILRDDAPVIFEGAQGVLLDESFGFHPHTTWSTTTFANAQTLLDETGFDGRRTRLGVLRSYFTRHGAGPLVTERPELCNSLAERHNSEQSWAGNFRVGIFDAVAVRYALSVASGADFLAITHLDRLNQLPKEVCNAYQYIGDQTFFTGDAFRITEIKVHRPASLAYQEALTKVLQQCQPLYSTVKGGDQQAFLQSLEHELKTPIAIISSGPLAEDKQIQIEL